MIIYLSSIICHDVINRVLARKEIKCIWGSEGHCEPLSGAKRLEHLQYLAKKWNDVAFKKK